MGRMSGRCGEPSVAPKQSPHVWGEVLTFPCVRERMGGMTSQEGLSPVRFFMSSWEWGLWERAWGAEEKK